MTGFSLKVRVWPWNVSVAGFPFSPSVSGEMAGGRNGMAGFAQSGWGVKIGIGESVKCGSAESGIGNSRVR